MDLVSRRRNLGEKFGVGGDRDGPRHGGAGVGSGVLSFKYYCLKLTLLHLFRTEPLGRTLR